MSAAAMTSTEVRLLAALKALVARCELDGMSQDSQPALNAARSVIVATEPDTIPVGEAAESDFGAFMDEVRK